MKYSASIFSILFLVVAGYIDPSDAFAGSQDDIANYQTYKLRSSHNSYRFAAAVRRSDSTGISTASAVAIAPDVFLTAGHFTPRDNSSVAFLTHLAFGPNYNSSTNLYTVSHTLRFPTYVFNDPNTIDLGIGWTSDFIEGFTTETIFSSGVLGEKITMVDYGNYGSPATGELRSLGDRLAGEARVITDSASPYPASLYSYAYYPTNGGGLSQPTIGLQYSSGAPWYSSNGDLVMLTVAATGSISGGVTIGVRLDLPQIQSVLVPIIHESWTRFYATFTPGDSNLDRQVDFADLLTLAQNYGRTTGTTWREGDFNFDGAVNFADLLALAQNYGTTSSLTSAKSKGFATDWTAAQKLVKARRQEKAVEFTSDNPKALSILDRINVE